MADLGIYFNDADTLAYASQISSITVMRTAGPMLLAFIVLEGLLSFFRKNKTNTLSDTINSISHGMFERLISRLTNKTLEFGVYCYIYAHWAPFHLEEGWALGIVTFLGVDLGYYWFHRMAHEINLFWATHSVHHSSEEYNLSTAMRQSALQTYCSWMFYLPLALFVPPRFFYLHLQVNLIYQFWIHTKHVSRLGPLEWVLNTPSHHRVHHGRNARYLDRNYGGVLIIFDRMFGTFQAEDETVAYGLVHPSQSFNMLEGQFSHFLWMWQRLREERGFWDRWAVVWKGPGWHKGTPRLGDPSEVPAIDPAHRKYHPTLPLGFKWYLLLNFFCNAAFSVFINLGMMQIPKIHLVFVFLFAFSLQTLSMISNNSPAAPYLEALRTGVSIALDLYCYASSAPGQYRILWYTDRMEIPGAPAPIQFSPLSPGFVIYKVVVVASFFFMVAHILANLGLLQRLAPNIRKKLLEYFPGDAPTGLDARADEKLSIANVKVGSTPSPTSKTRSRKARGIQLGVAI